MSDPDRIKKAVHKFIQRETDRYNKKKNKKPEEAVVKEMLDYYEQNGFYVRRFEAKAKKIATQSGKAIWTSTGLDYGTPDLLGCCPSGFIHANEVKARGRRSTLREDQREFLENIIHRGGFGICADSVDYLDDTYHRWIILNDVEQRINFLLSELPKKRMINPIADASA